MSKYILLIVAGLMSTMVSAQQLVHPYLADRSIQIESINVSHSGSMLLVTMELNIDSLYLPANKRYVFTPLVKGKSEEVVLPQIVLNGRRQAISYERGGYKDYGEDAVSIYRKNKTSQTEHYTAVIPYEEWMNNLNVEVIEDYCGCGDVLNQKVSLIHKLRTPYIPYIRPKAETRKERNKEGRAYIDFPVNKIALYPDYRNNPHELEKIVNTINEVKEDKNTTITGISIHGYASPESSYDHNAYLAENRARTLKDYVRRLVHLDDSVFSVYFTPEDWEGLRNYVNRSELVNKVEIMSLIDDTTLDPDSKERRIKLAYPDDYRYMLENWYPALRHSDYIIVYNVRPFSVEEAKEIMRIKPQQLSLEEMFLVAQTYEPGTPAFNEVMETAARMFPEDEIANINAACARLDCGDLEGARRYINKAGNTLQTLHVRGVLAILEGNVDQARQLLKDAQKAGFAEAGRNLELLDF